MATPADLAGLRLIQLAAGAAFRDVAMPEIADNPPTSIDELAEFQRDGRAWVAVDDRDDPIAFALAEVIDRCGHVEQISVHPDAARQGIGRMLLDHVAGWAADQGMPALTLTTFRAVPWNAPYYVRCGFRELAAAEVTPGLAAGLAAETAFGLDPVTRVCMRREIDRVGPSDDAEGSANQARGCACR